MLSVFLDVRLWPAAIVVALSAAFALGGCDTAATLDVTDPSVIQIGPNGATAADCTSTAEPPVLTNGGVRRPSMQWSCATYSNLVAQVANPQDLVAPATLNPADGAVAAAAVRRYETGHVKTLDNSTSTSSSSVAPGAGGSGSSSTGGSN
ncbi:CpaD family pilus assembly lipoprotein [Candidatus Burkholderia verschuerenii]|uniref:CpaD family pilus assembly lipoprotein n=1 Tax=Candidatus Burkholderia verschuerenii TaxID=242163 RepID=UPI00067C4EA1|nr:CpaD family pilus assembly lipoprotein [Candidatus Burkholderia verschuerenii]